ncbi:N-acetylmuramic acid 6-phosphate etherase [bacterium]|nr:N-acetylmuramic acid 6-phosphate etherase [bacterium]
MRKRSQRSNIYLGIECGGTRTVAIAVDTAGQLVKRLEGGPANWRLLGNDGLQKHLNRLAKALPAPAAVAIGMAGVRGDDDRAQVRTVAEGVWRNVPIHTSHDLETALWAAGGSPEKMPRVIALSGTGSCCYGRSPNGTTVKIGGWGHILGDKGSGYEIGLRALKAVVFYLDRDGDWTELGQRILRATQLNDPEQLIAWVQSATKDQVAALALEVFESARQRDKIARDILEGAAHVLAKDAVACARRLAAKGRPVEFVFAGSVLQKQPAFAGRVRRAIKERWPKAAFKKLTRETAWGAVELARQGRTGVSPVFSPNRNSKLLEPTQKPKDRQNACPTLSPTEQRNPRSMRLDRLSVGDAVELMLSEDAKIPAAIRREREPIEKLIDQVVRSFKRGGRLFYVGAGTSGRLGILDVSECPPTFRTTPEMVQGIIAGGQTAIWSAVEGAEDDSSGGAQAIRYRGISKNDVVVGIAASGRTPFVWGALREAKARHARTALICFNPNLQVRREDKPGITICPRIGPEVLTGSTRLKAGTATKLILNMITTIAMVRLGKVISNLMVDLNPSNVKLRDRATRIVATLTEHSMDDSRTTLERERWNVKRAVKWLKRERPR